MSALPLAHMSFSMFVAAFFQCCQPLSQSLDFIFSLLSLSLMRHHPFFQLFFYLMPTHSARVRFPSSFFFSYSSTCQFSRVWPIFPRISHLVSAAALITMKLLQYHPDFPLDSHCSADFIVPLLTGACIFHDLHAVCTECMQFARFSRVGDSPWFLFFFFLDLHMHRGILLD